MKKLLTKIDKALKAVLPYTALLAVLLGVVNLIYLKDIQNDVEYTYSRVDDVETAINNISTDYDNSDVINMIKRSHNSIVNEINEAERKLSSDIIIFGN
jgi:Na+/H+ antiporter NhaB